ncbi:unnamed protein product [Strongylus vulgaris]|uniref:Uncharacterized protein n=1 Tax=Strongylus vulgaris TaxID=40348 RepID=A0A3P7JVH3_STRVU|nr:unnamed protein product [Strongylus vulgaris]
MPWILDQDTSTTRNRDCLKLTYNARTVSTNADLHALLEATGRIDYHVIALQEAKSRKTDARSALILSIMIHLIFGLPVVFFPGALKDMAFL